MSTSNEQPAPNEQSTPRFDTNVQGNVQQLIQIAQVQGSVNLFSQAVIDKLLEAIAAQGKGVDNTLQMREAVAQTLALLRSKNALYAKLDSEIWEYVFKSLRELRDALAQASSKLLIDGPTSVRSLLDLMVVAIRDYVAKYEAQFTLFMQSQPQGWSIADRQQKWPELRDAAGDLLSLRGLLIAAIEPLNAYAEKGQVVHWDQTDFRERKDDLTRAKPEPFDRAPLQTQDASTIATLISALHHKEIWVRLRAVNELAMSEQPTAILALGEALTDENASVGCTAVLALRRIGAPAVPTLANVLLEMNSQAKVREAAVDALREIGSSAAISAIITALSVTDIGVRYAAASALGKIGDPAAVPVLITALSDTDVGVRMAATYALGKIGDPAAIPALINTLYDQDSYIRYAAAYTLGKIGDPAAIPDITTALKNPDSGVREAAIKALGEIGGPAAIPVLITALNDTDSGVRNAASQTLSKLQSS